jgi:cysteinyl-tRNA synthetase
MHTAFLNMGNEKMSKSLGNFFTARDILNQYGGREEVIRFFLLRGHYRSQLSYTEDALKAARKELDSLYRVLPLAPLGEDSINWADPYAARFKAAMDDDFNTWEAFTVLSDLRHEISRSNSAGAASLLKALGGTLGLLQQDPEKYLRGQSTDIEVVTGHLQLKGGTPGVTQQRAYRDEEIDRLRDDRNEARKTKNFAEADRIRKQLDEAGVLLEDKPSGITLWRWK